MSQFRIVAVVVDPRMLTLYKADGSTLEIPQGDARIQTVLEAMPVIEQQGYADIEFTVANPYKDFEELTKEAVRFFRIAKRVVDGILAAADTGLAAEGGFVAPVGSVGSVPGSRPETRGETVAPVAQPTAPAAPEVPPMSQRSAVEEIMAQAQPVTDPNFSSTISDTDTIVAVSGDAVITGAEQLASHLAHSKKVGSTIGMENFFKRIQPVIKDRRHSVEDLLRFMEKNDLPIADDGSLIVYKVLKKRGGVYYDCHTGRVPQRIGSFVCVPDSLVDLNRDRECSNGLHVARRGYIGGFSGDVCTIVKVAPEDVMTVPHRDPDKVRVRGYHILMELENDAWQLLKRNTPMTSNPKAQKMLGRAVAGDHIGIIERVQINGQQGSNVVVTPVQAEKKTVAKQSKTAVALDDESVKTPEEKVDAEAQGKAIEQVIKEKAKVSPRQQKALDLMEIIETSKDEAHRYAAAVQLVAHKRQAKVSWGALGLSDAQATKAMELAAQPTPAAQDQAAALQEEADANGWEADIAAEAEEADLPEEEIVPTGSTYDTDPITLAANQGRKARLFEAHKLFTDVSAPAPERANAGLELIELRGRAKKSWTALGYPELTDQLILSDIEKLQQPPAQAPETLKEYPDTQAGRARKLFDERKFGPLYDFKQSSKKSWVALGFNDSEIEVILANKPGA